MNQEYSRARAHSWALAAAGVAAIFYLGCAAIVALWPAAAGQLLGWVTHVVRVKDFAGNVTVTPLSLIAGLIEVILYAYLGVWLLLWLHAKLSRR